MTTSNSTEARAKRLAEQVAESARFSREQSASLQRWVLASCLSVNGGAIIALLSVDSLDERSRWWALGWFLMGIVSAIAFGIAIGAIMSGYASLYKKATGVFHDYATSGDSKEFQKLETKKLGRLNFFSKAVSFVQGFSLLSFVIGVAIAVEGLK